MASTSTSTPPPLQYAPWTSDIELAFYSALGRLKLEHDKLDSSARKVLGLYEISHRDIPERSARMQIHAAALTTDESPQNFYRAEGLIRNFNTLDDFRNVDKAAFIERAGHTIWDAINDGTIYSCPSLLCSFSAICYADLKKYKFTYHFAYPCLHSSPQWKLVSPYVEPVRFSSIAPHYGREEPPPHIAYLGKKETETLVDNVQTWRYSVDTRQHGFFLAKRIRRHILEAQWRGGGAAAAEIEEEKDDDGNMNIAAQKRRKSRTHSLGELGFLWSVGSLASYENGFFDNAEPEDRFVCFADPSTYPANPGWMLRNLLVLVRERWRQDEVQVLCYRDSHTRREHPTSLVLRLQSAEPLYGEHVEHSSEDAPAMPTSSALRPTDVDRTGELVPHSDPVPQPKHTSAPEHPPKRHTHEMPKVTGWERNEHNKLTSKTVDLAAYMDPSKLADQAVDLNLKLIKWRISPSINLDAIKHTSCLLLGAGTLGCYVARGLMGWGVRKITFVDNGRVSYSNPVRQPLYDFKDCENGGARKAERAADVLSEIYPGIDARGYDLAVPMVGHAILDEEAVKKDFEKLNDLIDTHDAVFLLMDTRESRWLPTVMGKAAGKIVINAALGFDTYVVMRHGVDASSTPPPKPTPAQSHLPFHPPPKSPPLHPPHSAAAAVAASSRHSTTSPHDTPHEQDDDQLGCYFCSDVVAPADSLKSATLDQQCTVTRPGAALLASALAVELLVSITQHPMHARAPAPPPLPAASTANTILPAPPTDPSQPGAHPLGTVPHQLRGFMSTWQTVQVAVKAYDHCAACSGGVVGAYKKEGWGFVRRAVNEKGWVEEVSGLAEVQRRAEEVEKEVGGWGSEEEEDEEDGMGEGELV